MQLRCCPLVIDPSGDITPSAASSCSDPRLDWPASLALGPFDGLLVAVWAARVKADRAEIIVNCAQARGLAAVMLLYPMLMTGSSQESWVKV
jgi:hypothetical protein